MGALLVGLLTLGTAGAWMLNRRVVDPLRSLNEAARTMAEGDFTPRVDLQSMDEVGTLGLAINQIGERVQTWSVDLRSQISEAHLARAELELANERLVGLMSGLPTVVFDLEGKVVSRNGAFDVLLAKGVNGDELEDAARRAAAAVASLSGKRSDDSDAEAAFVVAGKIHLHERSYTVKAVLVEEELVVLRRQSVCVTIEPDGSELPGVAEIRERFGLTEREAEIALLLARGASNKKIADRLGIQPSTVRTHTEHLFPKLRVNSRKALGLVLMGPVNPESSDPRPEGLS
jgi:DNA-binding CsgD family transcriptional regulator/nitrogen fixation/metabolism regulation signal transduction histidine kinase